MSRWIHTWGATVLNKKNLLKKSFIFSFHPVTGAGAGATKKMRHLITAYNTIDTSLRLWRLRVATPQATYLLIFFNRQLDVGSKIRLYGSSLTGFALKSSNINLDLLIPASVRPHLALLKSLEALKSSSEFR